MFGKKNEFGDETETIVGPSVSLKGNLRSDGNIKLKGKVSGEIKTKGDVFVAPEAEVKASISTKNIKIAGTVTGDINATGEVEIKETGKVVGNINTGALIIRMGALFIGKSTMDVEPLSKELKEEKTMEPEPELEQ